VPAGPRGPRRPGGGGGPGGGGFGGDRGFGGTPVRPRPHGGGGAGFVPPPAPTPTLPPAPVPTPDASWDAWVRPVAAPEVEPQAEVEVEVATTPVEVVVPTIRHIRATGALDAAALDAADAFSTPARPSGPPAARGRSRRSTRR
jgi:hypothetical protein